MTESLAQRMKDDHFAGYAYAYPHKTSYRRFSPPVPLEQVWKNEKKDDLFLYVHLPFCEMRCGFCNLFTTVQPKQAFVDQTLATIKRQSRIVANHVRPESIQHFAVGGGTPSFLSTLQLEQLFLILQKDWDLEWPNIHGSFEVSPATITEEKISLLQQHAIERVSMGVQSFHAQDLKQLGRPQSQSQVIDAITLIQKSKIPIFNLDLIYGVEGQSHTHWKDTLRQTVDFLPEEIYLYPLYVRELTGLDQAGKAASELRRSLYLAGRDFLLEYGYQQKSMRHFRRSDVKSNADYCCQEDGMIGLGPGARSYTTALHYSSEYAVGRKEVKSIITDFNSRTDRELEVADYGTWLDVEEQRRRYLIKSILKSDGLDYQSYLQNFSADVESDFPHLSELFELNLAERVNGKLKLNANGLSWSDVIGPWLYSAEIKSKMKAFELA